MRTKEEILNGESERLFLTSCYFNLEKWGERVLGLTLKPFHKEWLSMLRKKTDHNKPKLIAISAPTGFGKTMIFGITYPLWMAYFKPKSVIVIVSNSIRTQSSKVLEEIRFEIENNEILNSLKPENAKATWTKEKLITSNGSIIQFSSNTPNIRGIQADYVFADEVAQFDDQEVFNRDVSSRVNSKKGTLAAVSTPINTSDLLEKLKNNPLYISKTYPALVDKQGKADINGESIWPEKFSKEYLLNLRKKDGLSNFEKNYMCNPKAEAEQPFFTLASVEDCYDVSRSLSTENEGGQVYLGCDFAYASGPTADFDCFVVVEYVGDKVILRHGEYHRGMPIPAKLQRIRELNHIYNPIRIVVDPNNVGQGIMIDLRSEGLPIEEQSFQSLARRKLLIDLKILIDNKRLIIPRNLESPFTVTFTDKLTEELIGFRDVESRITKVAHLVSSAAHDDTVMALAMACKGAHLIGASFDDCIGVG